MEKSEWNGYRRIDFLFEGRESVLICPTQPRSDGKWLFKTEYFGAFPKFELGMLARGYYVAHMKSITRWCPPEDTAARARFCAYLAREFGLAERCMPVGMSCGGMQAVYLASYAPERVAALYLDAPVMNLLSCPCGIGHAKNTLYEEFVRATGRTVADLINDRNQPVDHIDRLLKHGLPVALVCGDRDGLVPYEENGKVLSDRYRQAGGKLLEILKAGCDHHPHGLDDPTPLYAFAERFYGDDGCVPAHNLEI